MAQRAALQSVAVQALTGNDVSGPLFSTFLFFSSSSSPASMFLKEWLLRSKRIIIQKLFGATKNPGVDPFHQLIWNPWPPYWVCRRCSVVGSDLVKSSR